MAVVLPFGKYRGATLDVPPTDYLRWVVRVVESPTLRAAIDLELASRAGMHRDVRPTAPVDPSLAVAIVRAGVRTVAAHQHVPLDDPPLVAAADFLFVAITRGAPCRID
jgi:hypothetical protein